jgi:cytosine permease
MIITTLFGFGAINRLSVALVPVMMLVAVGLALMASQHLRLYDFIQHPSAQGMSVSQGVGLIVGVIIIGAIILPDITRFSRQQTGGPQTAFWSYFVAQSLAMIIAGYAAIALAQNTILSLLLAMGMGSWILLVIIAGSWILNSLNLYSARLATSASFRFGTERSITLALGILGTLAAFANILDHFVGFLSLLTAIFIPVAGIIAVDFLWFNREAYFQQQTHHNFPKWPATFAWMLGGTVALISLFYPLPTVTRITALDAIMVSALSYLSLMLFVSKRGIMKT